MMTNQYELKCINPYYFVLANRKENRIQSHFSDYLMLHVFKLNKHCYGNTKYVFFLHSQWGNSTQLRKQERDDINIQFTALGT